MEFEAQLGWYQQRCEQALEDAAARYFTKGSKVSEAAEYALLGGGKRVRGVLVQACGALVGAQEAVCADFAAAIEMIHAFSLVHDDLPCMDDDDMRRGRPATHIAFGEATALLAGDLLAIEAFNVIAGAPAPGEARARAAAVLATAAGARGMIYGQELDLANEKQTPSEEALRQTYRHKTGALLLASARLGVAAAGKKPEEEPVLAQYAQDIGLVFQIVDDILDVTSTNEELGKPIGSDAQQGKTTFVTLFGLEKARQEVESLTAQTVEALQKAYGEGAGFLAEYARRLASRVK